MIPTYIFNACSAGYYSVTVKRVSYTDQKTNGQGMPWDMAKTKQDLIKIKGKPNRKMVLENGNSVYKFYDAVAFKGVLVMLYFLPLPLFFPVGIKKSEYEIDDNDKIIRISQDIYKQAGYCQCGLPAILFEGRFCDCGNSKN